LALTAALKERWITLAAVAPWLLLMVLTAWGQYSLYLFGHNLDPERPLRYLEPFTPPIVGWVTMGKILTLHFPNIGSALFVAAGALLVFRAWRLGRIPLPWKGRVGGEAPLSQEGSYANVP
jgi:hypothetical protein